MACANFYKCHLHWERPLPSWAWKLAWYILKQNVCLYLYQCTTFFVFYKTVEQNPRHFQQVLTIVWRTGVIFKPINVHYVQILSAKFLLLNTNAGWKPSLHQAKQFKNCNSIKQKRKCDHSCAPQRLSSIRPSSSKSCHSFEQEASQICTRAALQV